MSKETITRVLSRGLIAAGLLLAIVLPAGGPASAAPGDLTCASNLTAEFTPPLTLTVHQTAVHVSAALSACTGTQSGVTGPTGDLQANGEGPLSCGVTGSVGGQGRIEWDGPGQPSSHFDFTLTLQVGQTGFLLVLEGTVTSGTMQGDTLRAVFVPTGDPIVACTSPDGLSSISGVTPITFE